MMNFSTPCRFQGFLGFLGYNPATAGILTEPQAEPQGFQRFQHWLICSPVRWNRARARRSRRQSSLFLMKIDPVSKSMTDGRYSKAGASCSLASGITP